MFEKMKQRTEQRRLEMEAREREEKARREEAIRREKERLMSLSEKELLVELYMKLNDAHGDIIDTYNICSDIKSTSTDIYNKIYDYC